MACEAWDVHLTQQGGRPREGWTMGQPRPCRGSPGSLLASSCRLSGGATLPARPALCEVTAGKVLEIIFPCI